MNDTDNDEAEERTRECEKQERRRQTLQPSKCTAEWTTTITTHRMRKCTAICIVLVSSSWIF